MTSPARDRVCRFTLPGADARARVGAIVDETVIDLAAAGVAALAAILDAADPSAAVQEALVTGGPRHRLADVVLLPPIERQEVWAAGVTYLRSKTARMEESDFSATAYDCVYEAARPEIFFKAVA